MIQLTRSGNALEVAAPPDTLQKLAATLCYKHKTSFQGEELRGRKAALRADPTLRFNPYVEIITRSLCQMHQGKLLTMSGMRQRVAGQLDAWGLEHTFRDIRHRQLPPPDLDNLAKFPGGVDFRHGQPEVLACMAASEGGLFEAPTGWGKTQLGSWIGYLWPHARIAWISPGLDLIRSTYNRFSRDLHNQVGRVGGGYCETDRRVLLCSADSLHKLPLGELDLVLVDEVHELATDRRMGFMCQSYSDATFFGFSASLNRRFDGADAQLECFFGPVLHRIGYQEAVTAGVVVPIDVLMVDIPACAGPADPSGESWRKQRDCYWNNAWRNALLAQAVTIQAPALLGETDPQILAMTSKVEHAFNLREHLPGFEMVYANMDPKVRRRLGDRGMLSDGDFMTPIKRAGLLRRFESGSLRRVISTHCWKKGINAPALSIFGRFDGETSSINSIQLPGRLSRVFAGKTRGLIVDAMDNFSDWSKARSMARLRDYRQMGFHILEDSP